MSTPEFTQSSDESEASHEKAAKIQQQQNQQNQPKPVTVKASVMACASAVRGLDGERVNGSTASGYEDVRARLLARKVMAGKFLEGSRDARYIAIRRHLIGTTERGSRKLTPLPGQNARPQGGRAGKKKRESGAVGAGAAAGAGPGSGSRKGPSLESLYAFGGLHHLFDENAGACVTSVRFAHNDADLLAWSGMDGTLSIANVKHKPEVLHRLKGHKSGILDFSWSANNDYLASVSQAEIKLWSVATGEALRTIANPEGCPFIVIHPINPNLFAVGSGRQVKLLNMSTGLAVVTLDFEASPLAACFDDGGSTLFVGDSAGVVTSTVFRDASRTARVAAKHRLVLCASGAGITSLSFKRLWTAGKSRSVLLANTLDSQMRLLVVTEPPCESSDLGTLRETHRFSIVQREKRLRSVFCPLISGAGRGACIVSGSEDGTIFLFDVTAEHRQAINKLQGHSSAVIAVDWNYDETVLASGDSTGMVLLWKRETSKNTEEGI
jgi:hypothetical protein